jgi:hypothetical protein
MSKVLGTFVQKAQAIKSALAKFTATAVGGNRIIPSETHDAEFQLRIDASHYDANIKRLNVVPQVNSHAKSPALREWARENPTHENLAIASFDTNAEDKKAECGRS